MNILSIDPGCTESAYVILDENLRPVEFEKIYNDEMICKIKSGLFNGCDYIAIEMIASYGMSVGQEVFDTCVWIGIFEANLLIQTKIMPKRVYRKEVKINLCGSMRAKDSNIKKALIDRFAKYDFKNGKGTKKEPDWFHGFHSDIWAAYAVGITYHDMYLKG